MARKLTIICYHYIRELKHSRYPGIKGVSLKQFKDQVSFLQKKYTIITMEELIEAIGSASYKLPRKSLLLTFDDGHIDHFTNVFPVLDEKNIQGSFFPPAKAILNNKVLDVNKVQFIIAAVPDKNEIIKFIYSCLDEYRDMWSLETNQYYYRKLARKWRLDTKEVMFIKRMLQKELPNEIRLKIVDKIFKKYISIDEKSLSIEQYVNLEQLRCMKRKGMYIGGHGYNHYWMASINKDIQEREIDLTRQFLKRIGCDINNWVMCYPFGSYNNNLISILRNKNCKVGLGTKIGVSDIDKDNHFSLLRIRPNDLPV